MHPSGPHQAEFDVLTAVINTQCVKLTVQVDAIAKGLVAGMSQPFQESILGKENAG
jgi:hypothetical protein